MLLYVLIGLCLSLAGVAGLQLTYMFYLDRIDNELASVKSELKMKNDMLAAAFPEFGEEEAWADVIDDR